jgi:hypothetical protein
VQCVTQNAEYPETPEQPLSYVRGSAKPSKSNRAANVRERSPAQSYTSQLRTHTTTLTPRPTPLAAAE